jgi:hypothetical protein
VKSIILSSVKVAMMEVDGDRAIVTERWFVKAAPPGWPTGPIRGVLADLMDALMNTDYSR